MLARCFDLQLTRLRNRGYDLFGNNESKKEKRDRRSRTNDLSPDQETLGCKYLHQALLNYFFTLVRLLLDSFVD